MPSISQVRDTLSMLDNLRHEQAVIIDLERTTTMIQIEIKGGLNLTTMVHTSAILNSIRSQVEQIVGQLASMGITEDPQ